MLEVPVGLYRHRHSLAAMGSLALSGLRRGSPRPLSAGSVSGFVPAYDPALGKEFIAVTHGENNGFVPPTFYVTWAMAALAEAVVKVHLPYDFSRTLHAASEYTYQRPLSPNEPARYEVHVADVDDNERRARIRVEGRVTEPTGAEIFTQAMELHVPKKRGGGKHTPPTVGPDMQRVTEFRMPRNLGQRYALVSGDFNPVHWSFAAAKLLGFKRNFIQGYCTKAMIAHALMRRLGGQDKLHHLRVEFKKPIFLPADVSLFIQGNDLAVGTPGEAFVTGIFR